MTTVRAPDRAVTLEDLGRAFKAVTAALRRLRGRETHRPGELSYAQHSLMFSLAEGDELPAGELAVAADLSPATVTQMLDGLANAGLVRRVRSERDKRVVLVSLTDRGRDVVDARRALLEPRWRAALAGFGDDELRTAAAVLGQLRTMFDELAEQGVTNVTHQADPGS